MAGDFHRDGGPGMFDSIARRYDLLNRLLSAGLDGGWRKRAIRELEPGAGQVILDLCAGTGDFGLAAAAAAPVRVIALDVARRMTLIGAGKARRRGFASRFCFGLADAEALPLADDSVDGALIAFGIRNVPDRGKALRELARVIRPGGRLIILEFGVPPNPVFRSVYFLYFRHVLPILGGWISGNPGAYAYLPESVRCFPDPLAFCALCRDAGFARPEAVRLSKGIVTLYRIVR